MSPSKGSLGLPLSLPGNDGNILAVHFCNLNVPVAARFQFRSLFHRDDVLGIPTDDLIFDNVAQDKQSVARILVCQ